MDYQLPEELRMLEAVRRFVDRELIPIEQDSMDGPKLKAEVQGSLEEKAKAIGLWLFDVPEEYGGQGLGLLARSIVWTELARTIALPRPGTWISLVRSLARSSTTSMKSRKNVIFRFSKAS